jgi:GNAT superfamily N-acetyltransferase
MSKFIIKIAKDYDDSIIISNHISDIWNDNIDKNYYDNMFKYLSIYNEGYLIGFLNRIPIASSIAFPINKIPSVDEINAINIFDFTTINGKFYYIHVIQVIEEYRNKGFGVKLLRKQINNAINNNNIEVIGMSIDKELSLWKKCGFKEFGDYFSYKNYGRMKWVKMIL